MRRAWAGVAVLAASWLVGLGYYHHVDWGSWLIGLLTKPLTHDEAYLQRADWLLWAAMVAAGTLLLAGVQPRLPGRRWLWAAAIVMIPAIWIWQLPYAIIPLLAAAGFAMAAARAAPGWVRRLGGGLATAAGVLLVQAAALYVYEAATARSHELPGLLADVLQAAMAMLGQDSALSGNTLGLHSMRQMHRLGATWELFFDPTCLAFLAGGAALLLVLPRPNLKDLTRRLAALALILAAWLPVRAGLLVGLYLHRVLVTDYDAPLSLMDQFWSTPLLLALLAGPVLGCWKFLPAASPAPAAEAEEAPAPAASAWRLAGAAVLAVLAAAVLVEAAFWAPAGQRQEGRVLVDEFHSKWEDTQKPMDTDWYGHLSGYNYACAYDYLTRFYDMGRLSTAIGERTLDSCNVLVLKCPTAAYSPEEIDRIHRFVERGGGLVVIGEHTNVFGMGEYLNSVCGEFGFQFRYDCVFGIDSVFEELYRPPLVPHPIVQRMPPLDFAVSCSIAPGNSRGTAVIRALGLKNSPADYHASNFYPAAFDRPEMQYGAWVQLWATEYGAGRVVAFSDSTQFSNFSAFEPGKPELLLGMIEWANRRDGGGWAGAGLALFGLALAALALAMARHQAGAWAILLAAIILGHAAAAHEVAASNRAAMPAPERRGDRPLVLVTTDRTISGANLPRGGFIAGKEDGFGIFERWILRLGYFTERTEGTDFAKGRVAVIINPAKDVPDDYAAAVEKYVRDGGRLLVLDSPTNYKSTANTVLAPFGLEVRHEAQPTSGLLDDTSRGLPNIPVPSASEVRGGVPISIIAGRHVAACAAYGRGTVTVVGFSSRFSDAAMGVTGDTIPDASMRQVYEYEFALLKAIAEDRMPTGAVVPAGPAPPSNQFPPCGPRCIHRGLDYAPVSRATRAL